MPGTVPVCPGDRPVENVYVYWFFSCPNTENTQVREQKRHIKLLHLKLFPVAPVTGPPGRVSGQKDLCSLGSDDST